MHVIVDGIVYGRQRHGGINTYFNEVLPRLARQPDTHVDLLVPSHLDAQAPGPPVRQVCRDFIPPRTNVSWRLDQMVAPRLESLKLALFGLWAKTKNDAVFHSTYFTSLPTGLPQVAIAYDMNHELFPQFYGDAHGVWLRKRYPEYLRQATRVIAISETTKHYVEQYYRIDPALIDVVHLAVDPAKFYAPPTDSQRDAIARDLGLRQPYVLYVGGRWHYKNFPSVLEAMNRVYRRTGLTLVVAGSPWNEVEAPKVRGHPARGAIHLVPNPDDRQLRLLYSSAAAFVFPSLHEGFGVPLLEAMACGTPVAASDTRVFREIAGSAAIYFDPHDPDEVAKALECFVDDRTSQEYRERGLRQASKYSWDVTAWKTRLVYEKALRQVHG